MLHFGLQPRSSLSIILRFTRAYSSKPSKVNLRWQNRVSRELSYLLRHGGQSVGLPMRPDGYVNVEKLLRHHSLSFFRLDFAALRDIVREDKKGRYHLLHEPAVESLPGTMGTGSWWIRANQGHSMADITLDLKPVLSASEIPMAVHGTSTNAWKMISTRGLSRMSRNHIHLAQGVVGDVISGMRNTSEILIFIDVAHALDAGIKFYVSTNGVVLTPGNDIGILEPRFFSRVEYAKRRQKSQPILGRKAQNEDRSSRDEDK